MPSLLRLVPEVVPLVLKRLKTLNAYADHPETAPLRVRYDFCHEFALSILKPFRIRFVIQGQEKVPQGHAIFFPNHVTDFDAPVMLMLMANTTSFLAKKQICKFPIIDPIVRATDSVYINREDLRSEVKTIREVANKMLSDPSRNFAIWPEGKRSRDPIAHTMSPYKPGAFKAAYYAKATVVPMAIYGDYALLEFFHPDRAVYPVQVTFLDPIPYEEYRNLTTSELSAKCEALTQAEVARMRIRQPILESIFNQPQQALAYRADLDYLDRRLKAEWAVTKAGEEAWAKEYRKTHPANPFKYRPVVYTKEDRINDKLNRKRGHEERDAFLRKAGKIR